MPNKLGESPLKNAKAPSVWKRYLCGAIGDALVAMTIELNISQYQ